jgi:hypothetical protein
MKKLILYLFMVASFTACRNEDVSFPDYKFSGVYFAYQYPVRTITLGEDLYDTSLDNLHKCQIFATIAGVYDTKKDVTIDFVVADSLCPGFSLVSKTVGGRTADPTVPVTAMPHDYYTLASNQIVIKKGEISGSVDVQLTDKFFADPKALTNNYVIPLLMTKVSNADSILQGKTSVPNTKPRKLYAKGWQTLPKDYVLYCVKYINPWHAYYLRRGQDVITGSVNTTIVRRPTDITTYDAATDNNSLAKYLCYLTTTSLTTLKFPVTLKNASGSNVVCNLILTFDSATGKCTVSSSSPTEYAVSGSGQYVKKGEKNSFGNQDRDVLYLKYTINHVASNLNVTTSDTLLMRNRGVAMETFNVQ